MSETTQIAPTAPDLPEPVMRRNISEAQWRTLSKNLYPGADPLSVLMVWDYCVARRLDPLKKPCHIVPMEVKDARTNTREWRDVVMPGIYEYRITAHRTNLYLGHSEPEYGERETIAGVEAPMWCSMTMYRWNAELKVKAEFPVTVYFDEVVATNREGKANSRWSKAPIQMLTKCTEAAGLREAFPEEFGGEPTAEEMGGERTIEIEAVTPAATSAPQPAQRLSKPAEPVAEAPAATVAAVVVPAVMPAVIERPAHISSVKSLDERPNGCLVTLASGFRFGTRQAAQIDALKTLKESGEVATFVTLPAPGGEKFAPVLQEMLPAPGASA